MGFTSLAATTRLGSGRTAGTNEFVPLSVGAQSSADALAGMSSIRKKMNSNFAIAAAVDPAPQLGRYLKQGVTQMNWADPQRPDPPNRDPLVSPAIIEATKQALDSGKTFYTSPTGLLELRQAIAKKLRTYNSIRADPEKEIIITPGSDMGLYYAIRVLLSEGDEVLNPDPSYGCNFKDVVLCGARSISVPLRESAAFDFNFDEFEKRVTSRTKAIILTHPNNPTAKVYSKDSLERLSVFAIKHDLFVVADHAFEGAVFDGKEFVTIAALPGMWERTISVFSTSKGLGLSGYRVGYNVACSEIMSVMYGSAVNVLGATNTFAQYGALAGIADDGRGQRFNSIFDRRRKRAFSLLNAVPGVRCLLPESGFMMWVNISELGTSREIVEFLIQDAKVIVNSGTSYGREGEGFVRIILGSLASEAAFDDALGRIVKSLTKLAEQKLCA